MKTLKFIFVGLFVIYVLISCQKQGYYYQAQPVDLEIRNENGKIAVSGSSVFQLPDTFVWGASP